MFRVEFVVDLERVTDVCWSPQCTATDGDLTIARLRVSAQAPDIGALVGLQRIFGAP
jgi:hypothetical protein